MVEYLIQILLILIGYFTAYVVSLYSMAVNIDPDDIQEVLPDISKRWHNFLNRLAINPRIFLQIAVVYKSFVLIGLTFLVYLLLYEISITYSISVYWLCLPGFIILWLGEIFLVEYLPRRSTRKALSVKMKRHILVIYLVYHLFLPVIKLYLRAMKRNKKDETVSEEEKEDLVERAIETLAEQAGINQKIVEADEKEMIGQIFLLDQTIVREIMVPRIDITGIEKKMTFMDIRDIAVRDGHSRYPVYDETIDRVIGLIYIKDLFNNTPQPGEKFEITKYLREPYFVPETKIIGELLREFKIKRLHIAIVVDEYGGVAGLVTLEDIIEEIFGEIRDEHDLLEEEEYRLLKDGSYMVNAGMLVEDLQEFLKTNYEQGDYDTVGGLIYDLVGSVPVEGQVIKWEDLHFEIEEIEGQRIKLVRVKKDTH